LIAGATRDAFESPAGRIHYRSFKISPPLQNKQTIWLAKSTCVWEAINEIGGLLRRTIKALTINSGSSVAPMDLTTP
jgi:hypothetical protein